MIGTLIVPRGKTQLVRKGMKAATYLPFFGLGLGLKIRDIHTYRQLLLSPDPLGVFTSENWSISTRGLFVLSYLFDSQSSFTTSKVAKVWGYFVNFIRLVCIIEWIDTIIDYNPSVEVFGRGVLVFLLSVGVSGSN